MDTNNNSSVKEKLRIFEANELVKPLPSNLIEKEVRKGTSLELRPVSVNICSWSSRRRKGGPTASTSSSAQNNGKSCQEGKQQKRVSQMVQRFQGNQLPPSDVRSRHVINVKHVNINKPEKVTTEEEEELSKEDLYADIAGVTTNSRLPKGPPPQKPCRTFEHDIYIQSKALTRGQSEINKPKLPPKPTRSKTVPAMSGLQLTNNFNGKNRMLNNRPRTPPPPRPPPPPRILGGGSVKENSSRIHQYGCLKKCHSAERIYDEPWCSTWDEIQKRKSVGVKSSTRFQLVDNDIYSGNGGQTEKSQKMGPSQNGKTTEELHYMSSPIFPIGGRQLSSSSKVNVFPTPLTAKGRSQSHLQNEETDVGGSVRRVNFVDEDVLNWSFMSIYGSSNKEKEGGRTGKDVDSGDSDNEISEKELKKRIDYVHTVNRNPSMRHQDNQSDYKATYKKQFEAVLIVGLRYENSDNSDYQPYVKNIFPSDDCLTTASPNDLAHFCFPDAQVWKPAAARETYTFVLTNEKGDRTYGYCRRVKPEGVEYNIPVVYCILSPLLDRAYYSQLLREIEKRHGLPEIKMKSFIQTLYSRSVPHPGKTTIIRRSSLDDESQVALCRSNDYFSDNWDTSKLLSQMSITVLLKIFSSYLLERKVLFCASQPETLSETIHSLVSLLYPFRWPHTFIPILPNKLIEVVASPTPYIIGILTSSCTHLQGIAIEEEGIMVDLDSGLIVREVGDETTIIPKKVQRALATALKLIRHRINENEDGCPGSTLVSEAFLRMFIELVGHYQQHLTIEPDGKKAFNRETFSSSPLSRGIQMFLKWFTETQLFDLFVESTIISSHQSVFDERIRERQLDVEALKPILKYNVKEFSKKMKTFGEKLIGFKAVTSPKS